VNAIILSSETRDGLLSHAEKRKAIGLWPTQT